MDGRTPPMLIAVGETVWVLKVLASCGIWLKISSVVTAPVALMSGIHGDQIRTNRSNAFDRGAGGGDGHGFGLWLGLQARLGAGGAGDRRRESTQRGAAQKLLDDACVESGFEEHQLSPVKMLHLR